MRALIVILLLLASCVEAMACPDCSYQEMAMWYPPLVCIRLAVVPFLTLNRLDFFRVLGVFVGYEVLWYYAYLCLIWFVYGGFLARTGATLGIVLLQSGALGAGLLYLLGRSRFFRRQPDKGLPWWQAGLYVPVAIAIRLFV